MSKLTVRQLDGHVVINFQDSQIPLVDCQDMHDHYPDTFQVPSLENIRANAIAGCYAKVGVLGERFWVKIIHVFTEYGVDDGRVSFLGVVNNDLIFEDHGLNCDDLIFFRECNIFDFIDEVK